MFRLGAALTLLVTALVPGSKSAPDYYNASYSKANAISYEKFAADARRLNQSGAGGVSVRSEGVTAEGRTLWLFVLRPYLLYNDGASSPTTGKKIFWFEGGFDGNDLESFNFLMYHMGNLIHDCRNNGGCNNDYYFLPLANPDGYEYARNNNWNWVKNRQNNSIKSGENCKGVNINSNFPPEENFNSSNGSSDPCSDLYGGTEAGSSAEVKAIMKLKGSVPKIDVAITFKAARLKGMVLFPYASDTTPIKEAGNYKNLGLSFGAQDALQNHTEVMAYANWTIQSGTSMDYWYRKSPSTYSFTLLFKPFFIRVGSNSIEYSSKHVVSKGIANMAKTLSEMTDPPLKLSSLRGGECLPHGAISEYLREWSKNNPKLKIIDNYKTSEGRNIYLVIVKPYMQLRVRNTKHYPDRKATWIEGGLDANACNTVSVILNLIRKLSTNCPRKDPHCLMDYYFVPLANPDGYEYSRTVQSSWSKNRAASDESTCKGVSLNRNFPYTDTFGKYGGSDDPCNSTYTGPAAGSTDEVKALIAMKHSARNLQLSFTLMSSEKGRILYPSAITKSPPVSNAAKYGELSGAFPGYEASSHAAWRLQSGTSMGYWHRRTPACYSFTLAVPSDGAKPVKQTAEEILQSLIKMTASV